MKIKEVELETIGKVLVIIDTDELIAKSREDGARQEREAILRETMKILNMVTTYDGPDDEHSLDWHLGGKDAVWKVLKLIAERGQAGG